MPRRVITDRDMLIVLLKAVSYLINQGVRMANKMEDLQAKLDNLEAAEAAREARDVAQDAVTGAQMAALQTSIDELKAIIAAGGGGLSAADQAILDASITRISAVVTSLDAADPTPPVV